MRRVEQPITEAPRPSTRVRASEKAIRAALNAIQGAGLPVGKVCISGAKVEIHCGPVESATAPEKDEGLEEW